MNIRSIISSFLFAVVLILVGGVIGLATGFYIYRNFPPSWKTISITPTHSNSVDIVFVDERSTTDVSTDDRLYIKTQSGDIYSVIHNEWQLLPNLPNGETISDIRRKDGYADSPIVAITGQGNVYQLVGNIWEIIENPKEPFWGREPLQCANWRKESPSKKVIDSAGFVIEHALANFTKCFVLFDDGTIEVWTQETDAFSLMGVLLTTTFLGVIGTGIIGFIIKALMDKKHQATGQNDGGTGNNPTG